MKTFLYLAAAVILLASCKDNSYKDQSITEASNSSDSIQDPALRKSMEEGELIYMDFCVRCHMSKGEGVIGTFPPLAGSDWLTEKRTESIHSVKYGQQGEIVVNGETYIGVMAPMGLSDAEVADVMNFIMNSWGNTQEKMVTPEEVAAVEK